MSAYIEQSEIQERAEAAFEDVRKVRRHLHTHPELSFQEHETSRFVQGRLQEIGIPFQAGIVETGIVGMIEGAFDGPTVALRADLDALPIVEENDVSYKSQNVGVMHACGHDVHTASLLGAAQILNGVKNKLHGNVKLIFQPGEERLPGGASLMIKENVLENPRPNAIVGQHVYPELEAGQVGFKSGIYMASCDEIHVTVRGRGGHGAMPHKNIDPVLIASHLVIALQQVVSRFANPETPTVLSFGRFIAEGATNVIPNEVTLAGTFRTFDESWRADAHQKMKALAESLVQSMGGTVDFRIDKGYPYLINEPNLTERSRRYAEAYLGKENVVDLSLRMTAEDFAYYSQVAPACFYRLGVADFAKGIDKPVHNAQFDIDEQALLTGAGLMAWIAAQELSKT